MGEFDLFKRVFGVLKCFFQGVFSLFEALECGFRQSIVIFSVLDFGLELLPFFAKTKEFSFLIFFSMSQSIGLVTDDLLHFLNFNLQLFCFRFQGFHDSFS